VTNDGQTDDRPRYGKMYSYRRYRVNELERFMWHSSNLGYFRIN